MALELVLDVTTEDASCLSFQVDDVTGDYDVTTNPGGYGTPNPDRDTLGFFLRVLDKEKDVADVVMTVDNSNPAASSWTIAVSHDGYYYAQLFAAPLWLDNQTYSLDEIVCYSGNFYKALGDVAEGVYPTDPAYWVAVNIWEETTNTSIYIGTFDYIHSCIAEVCYSKITYQVAHDNCMCMDKDLLKEYVRMEVKLQSVFIDYNAQRYEQADEMLDSLANICNDLYDCGCTSR